jgi:hypothetical protein
MLEYRTAPLPTTWPGKSNGERGNSPFKSDWGATLSLLERELRHLNAHDVVLAIGVLAAHIRNDGGVRADARIREPGVVLSFTSGPDRLSFPCDRFNFWQDNVRAIALALEALRKVDRYGVQSGRQYQGFKALPGAGQSSIGMSTDAAALVLSALTGDPPMPMTTRAGAAREAVRSARAKAHPDRGGDRLIWDDVNQAAAILSAHHGVPL